MIIRCMDRHESPLRKLCLFCILLLSFPITAHAETLLQVGEPGWKYLNDGSDQGIAWQAESFDDSSWSTVPDPYYLYNATPVGTTVYIRSTFTAANPADYRNLDLTLLRDDGVVVYINGVEVYRNNMPAGAVAYNTPANAEVLPGDEANPVSVTLPNTVFHAGTNTIAVEVHQFAASNTDITFAMQLTGNLYYVPTPYDIEPYLQMITPTSAIVRWGTLMPSNSVVKFGLSAGSLTSTVAVDDIAGSGSTISHQVTLTGLTSATTYFYSVGHSDTPNPDVVLYSGVNYFFKTQPVVGTPAPTRLWVIGDSGTGGQGQLDVYNGYKSYVGSAYTDLWLMLGDNAYMSGQSAEYKTKIFDVYKNTLRNTAVWPTLGNHDGYGVDTPSETGPYYYFFTLPKAGEAGGIPSGTETYYSYNYGNSHFVVLDSFDVDRGAYGAMANWLRLDLAATTADWVIAYWHHSPYTNGSHNSDSGDPHDGSSTGIDSFNAMQEMRGNILPILESYGVDLVLTGHSHSYERSKFIKGHYFNSSTYTDAAHAVNIGSGDIYAGATAYIKNLSALPRVPATPNGTVYAVAGTSAWNGPIGTFPMMYRSTNILGSMVIDIDHYLLFARFIDANGAVQDTFVIQKYSAGTINDGDGDGINNGIDNCLTVANADQLDTDSDAQGNSCDGDMDGDGVPNGIDANLINAANATEIILPLNSVLQGAGFSARLLRL